MSIYYYVPGNERPSWGAGMIYYHVWLLQKNNLEAFVLHDKKPFKLSWLKLAVPFRYLDDKTLRIGTDDTLIIPEFYADLPQLLHFKCRKIVFVQNAFYIFDGLKNGKSYEDLGISQVFYYMPHLKKILQSITPLPLYEMPPFIAPYYYNKTNNERKRRIILYPKFANREYDILKRLLNDKLGLTKKPFLKKIFTGKSEWEIIELKDKSHEEVAREMQQAAFFISINTTEAFNSSVPEAMAAGCINICYEGVGPADFLENNINAFVFSNNHIYPMIEKIVELVTGYDHLQKPLDLVRTNARQTANNYTLNHLERHALPYFKNIEVSKN